MELIKTSLVWFGLVLALTLMVSAAPESGNKKKLKGLVMYF